MWEQFMLIPISELGQLELTCPKCKAIAIFKLREQRTLPENCPACLASWNGFSNKNLMTAYQGLALFFEMFGTKGMQMNPKFRVFSEETKKGIDNEAGRI